MLMLPTFTVFMNKRKLSWIIIVMSLALAGIISMQVYWIKHDIDLKEEQFEATISQALNAIVDRIETREAVNILHERVFDVNPGQISKRLFVDSFPDEARVLVSDTVLETPEKPAFPPSPFWVDLDNADINIEFHHPGNKQSFLRVKRRNYFHTDSVTQKTVRSSQIMRFYGDSAEVIIRQNEAKIKAKMEKLNEVMQRMAIEFSGDETDVSNRISQAELDTMICQELSKRGINMPFQFGVFNGNTDQLVFSSASANAEILRNAKYRILLFPNDIISKPDFLVLNFPESISYLLASIGLMLAGSTIFTLVILFGFAYTILTIIRQKKLSDIKSDFINNMTHEFKTPIATISLAADSIKDPRVAENPDKLSYFTRIIQEENRRMNSQVEHVLKMAQLDKGELQLKKDLVNIHDLILQAVELTSLSVESRGGKIHHQLEATLPVITGDTVHLSNVIFNLLDNANKYSPESPEITIRTQNKREGISVLVTDKGVGMTKETQKRIFDKFYRVTTGNIHDIKGFGLGLSYVKAIVDRHNGTIRVDSEPGTGSTFELYFPFK